MQQLPSIVESISARLVEPFRPLPIPITIFPGVRRTGLVRSKWWDLELSELSGLPFDDIERCLDLIERLKDH